MQLPPVARPPARALLLFDGACGFCRRWVERWLEWAAGTLEAQPADAAADRFPEIPADTYDRTVVLVEPDGTVWTGAQAVLRSLRQAPAPARWGEVLYRSSPVFARVAEGAYRQVASHRVFFSQLTRLLYGEGPLRAGFRTSAWLFGRALGLVGLIALLSYWVQWEGLIGSGGILPAADFHRDTARLLAEQEPGAPAWLRVPSLLWLAPSDEGVRAVFGLGFASALALLVGLAPPLACLGLWLSYLSLTQAGQIFLSFQWDLCLIQTAFLAVFFVPWRLWDRWGDRPEPPRLGRLLLWLMLFALMWESGIVKWQSFDPAGHNTWRSLTALEFHYWTQPIPSSTSWFIHHLPAWFDRFCLLAMLVIEVFLPLLFFAPRHLRHLAAAAQILLQGLILASGNYGYFNLLTLVLCLPLWDDTALAWRSRLLARHGERADHPWARRLRLAAAVPVAAVFLSLLPFQLWYSAEDTRQPSAAWPWLKERPALRDAFAFLARFRTFNSYGLFRVMTTTRPEIRLWGSLDGQEWREYQFRYKPGDPARHPPWIVPGHLPRLDWQMWFEGLRCAASGRISPWFGKFLQALGENRPEVLALLAHHPFPDQPPRFARVELHLYSFTSPQERTASGHWWKSQPVEGFSLQGRLSNR